MPAVALSSTPPAEPVDRFVDVRGLRHHVTCWHGAAPCTAPRIGTADHDRHATTPALAGATAPAMAPTPAPEPPAAPLRVVLHGHGDCGSTFRYMVEAMPTEVPTVAPDWRGFGRTEVPDAPDTFWFADYLADLDALLEQLSPKRPVNLVGHSMGGNAAMAYAALRPQRVRRVVNVEGFGLPDMDPARGMQRLVQWLDELREPLHHHDRPDAAAMRARIARRLPFLPAERLEHVLHAWAAPQPDGRWRLRMHPAHRRVHPVPFRVEDLRAQWQAIAAPVLFVQGRRSDPAQMWGPAYPQAELDRRLGWLRRGQHAWIDDAGHMLHLEQAERLARVVDEFLVGPA